MSARAAGYARLTADVIAVGVTYGDADSFARSVGPCARRGASSAPMTAGNPGSYAGGGWAWIGVDYAGSVDLPNGRNLAFGFLIRGDARQVWATTGDDESRPLMSEWSAQAHAFGAVSR